MLRLLIIGLILITGCQAYTPRPQVLPQHIKKIAVRPFVNHTSQLGLEDKLRLRIIDEFLQDTRFTITTTEDDTDGVLIGEITYYFLEPLSYDTSLLPQQYKLRIILNTYFIDKVNNITLWDEPNFEGVHIYYTSTMPNGITEEEAREIIWQTLAQKIARRTVEGFGTAAGISEKKIPTTPQK